MALSPFGEISFSPTQSRFVGRLFIGTHYMQRPIVVWRDDAGELHAVQVNSKTAWMCDWILERYDTPQHPVMVGPAKNALNASNDGMCSLTVYPDVEGGHKGFYVEGVYRKMRAGTVTYNPNTDKWHCAYEGVLPAKRDQMTLVGPGGCDPKHVSGFEREMSNNLYGVINAYVSIQTANERQQWTRTPSAFNDSEEGPVSWAYAIPTHPIPQVKSDQVLDAQLQFLADGLC
jgi:hypothetical protein